MACLPVLTAACAWLCFSCSLCVYQHEGTFVNPAMMVHYDSESSRETCSVVDCDPQYDEQYEGQSQQPCVVRNLAQSSRVSWSRLICDASSDGTSSWPSVGTENAMLTMPVCVVSLRSRRRRR